MSWESDSSRHGSSNRGGHRWGVTCSLLRGPGPPLDVGDLQDGQEQLEGVLDVRCTVGRLKDTKIDQFH